jgi:Leucine-rich repeat (LRR) protein
MLFRLSLVNTGISSVPASIVKCVGLEELDLAYNKFKAVPAELARIPRLKSVRLSGMKKISKLPTDLVTKPTLEIIEADGTRLKESDVFALRQLRPQLKVVLEKK